MFRKHIVWLYQLTVVYPGEKKDQIDLPKQAGNDVSYFKNKIVIELLEEPIVK